MIANASAAEQTTERRHEMEYDSRPDNLIREAVDEAIKANPQLVLEPYYQMKAAARILAMRLIEIGESQKARP